MKFVLSLLLTTGACLWTEVTMAQVPAPSETSAQILLETVNETNGETDDSLVIRENGSPRRYRFVGNGDDMILVYWDWLSVDATVELYGPEGELIRDRYRYPQDLELSEWREHYQAFQLPTTATYQLVVTPAPPREARPGFPSRSTTPAETTLDVRLATDYEQFMLQANRLIENEQYTAALPLLSQAIEQAPDIPQPYLWRAHTHAQLIRQSTTLDVEQASPETLRTLFREQASETQALILSDLRQAAQQYSTLAEKGEISLFGVDPERLNQLADFLETGTMSDSLREIFEGRP